MRTTDDPSPEKFQPFGPKVEKAPPPPPPAPKGQGPSGLVTDADGRTRTTTHKPHGW